MLHNLAFTFGTRHVLDQLRTEHADRKMVLLATSVGDDEGLQLVDASGQPSLFSADLEYRILLHQGATDWNGFYSFNYYQFDQDTADVFNAKTNRIAGNPLPHGMRAMYILRKAHDIGSYCVLTLWDDSQAYSLWHNSGEFEPLKVYATSANRFHSATYHRIINAKTN